MSRCQRRGREIWGVLGNLVCVWGVGFSGGGAGEGGSGRGVLGVGGGSDGVEARVVALLERAVGFYAGMIAEVESFEIDVAVAELGPKGNGEGGGERVGPGKVAKGVAGEIDGSAGSVEAEIERRICVDRESVGLRDEVIEFMQREPERETVIVGLQLRPGDLLKRSEREEVATLHGLQLEEIIEGVRVLWTGDRGDR